MDIDPKAMPPILSIYKADKNENSLRDFLRGKVWWEIEFKTSPRTLGEPIDLSGSGLVTLTEKQRENDPFPEDE